MGNSALLDGDLSVSCHPHPTIVNDSTVITTEALSPAPSNAPEQSHNPPQVNCRTDEYIGKIEVVAWIAFVLIVVGIPVYIFVILQTAVQGMPLCGVPPSAYLRDRISVSTFGLNVIFFIQIFTCHT